jgi:hypothetical protein
MKTFFVELLHCTLKVNPGADSTLCKNQEPTEWYTQKEVVMTLKHAERPGSNHALELVRTGSQPLGQRSSNVKGQPHEILYEVYTKGIGLS